MEHSSISSGQPELKTVGEVPEFGRKVCLICGNCGKQGKYAVGRVLIDPDWFHKPKSDDLPFDEAVSYSAIFFCKHCGADGPWKVPLMTRLALLASIAIPGDRHVHLGLLQMFDGTFMRTDAASEAYLKQKLQEQPENAFIWGRLGNFYGHAGLMDRSRAAYEKAVELDPHEAESQYNLGNLRRNEGDLEGAAKCFEAAIRHIPNAPRAKNTPPNFKPQFVRACLENLFQLHHETGGEVPFPPKFDLPQKAEGKGQDAFGLLDFDFPSEEGYEILTSIYLTGKVPERVRKRAAKDASRSEIEGGTVRSGKPPGRNDPCPCGSGKKYKRCCWSK